MSPIFLILCTVICRCEAENSVQFYPRFKSVLFWLILVIFLAIEIADIRDSSTSSKLSKQRVNHMNTHLPPTAYFPHIRPPIFPGPAEGKALKHTL